MIKIGRRPGVFGMAAGTIGRELGSLMVWITGGIKFIQVTTDTGIGRIGIITVMTGGTVIGNGRMGSVQDVIFIMISK